MLLAAACRHAHASGQRRGDRPLAGAEHLQEVPADDRIGAAVSAARRIDVIRVIGEVLPAFAAIAHLDRHR